MVVLRRGSARCSVVVAAVVVVAVIVAVAVAVVVASVAGFAVPSTSSFQGWS